MGSAVVRVDAPHESLAGELALGSEDGEETDLGRDGGDGVWREFRIAARDRDLRTGVGVCARIDVVIKAGVKLGHVVRVPWAKGYVRAFQQVIAVRWSERVGIVHWAATGQTLVAEPRRSWFRRGAILPERAKLPAESGSPSDRRPTCLRGGRSHLGVGR